MQCVYGLAVGPRAGNIETIYKCVCVYIYQTTSVRIHTGVNDAMLDVAHTGRCSTGEHGGQPLLRLGRIEGLLRI